MSAHPLRVQRSRRKGWRKPANCYEHEHLRSRPDLYVRDLAGRLLACTCPLDQPCHADVLARLANDPNPKKEER